jgi:hypothetical protein
MITHLFRTKLIIFFFKKKNNKLITFFLITNLARTQLTNRKQQFDHKMLSPFVDVVHEWTPFLIICHIHPL